jgi:hypothetical protein
MAGWYLASVMRRSPSRERGKHLAGAMRMAFINRRQGSDRLGLARPRASTKPSSSTAML